MRASAHRWDLIPGISAAYAPVIRNLDGAVVDPSLALSQRADCRKDFLHALPAMLVQSTWRMLQAAFEHLKPSEASGAMTRI